MKAFTPSLSALLSAAAISVATVAGAGIAPGQITDFVTFGDSYTDVVWSPSGTPWPFYASSYTGIAVHPFAHAGATCSNNITSRPFPSVYEAQIPEFQKALGDGSLRLDPNKTLVTLWIGTNDLGSNALLTNPGTKTIVDVATCAVNWVQTLYGIGARNFLFQNIIPLNRLPSYSPTSYPDRYWNAQRNTTEWSIFIAQLVAADNTITKLLLENLAPTLNGSHIGIFDSYSLFSDILANPGQYLNGTAPVNTTGAIDSCVYNLNGAGEARCATVTGTARDSYLWYDELHPSEQANRIVAKNVAEVLQGKENKYTTWIS